MFRRAVEGDKYDIELIWKREHTDLLFYDVDIGALIELSVLAICMINEDKEIMGFMALSDYPDVPGLDPGDWENWIRNLYHKFYLSRNTLFIHFMCSIDSVTDFFVDEALASVFLNDCYLQYIVLSVPSFCPDEIISRFHTFKKRNIYKYAPKSKEVGMGNYLYTALRTDFCPRLKLRRAVEEDNDDIVEILHKKCPRLKELYGEYYISEIIGRHPESNRKIIVADIHGRAVAVMCLNTDINYKKLQKLYELRPYHGLKNATVYEKEQNMRRNTLLCAFGEPIMLGQWGPFDSPAEIKRSSLGISRRRAKHPVATKKSSRVNFTRGDAGQEVIVKVHSDEMDHLECTPSVSSIYSVVNLLDEDPFDYEIVNIDTALFNVAEEKSHEYLPNTDLNAKPSFLQNPVLDPQMKQLSCTSSYFRKVAGSSQAGFMLDHRESEMYHGPKNAFMIELCAFREDMDDRHAYDLLEAAFELMKDYDYCIIRVPAEDFTFPLLQHFTFVPTKQKVCCNYSLYIAHRSSVLGKLRVREAEIADIPEIARLMRNLDGKETLTTIESTISKKENMAYVFTSGLHVVGLGILEDPEQIGFLRARFNLSSYRIHKYHLAGNGLNTGLTCLKVAIIYPVFEPHFRFFAREMLRLSGHNSMLWLTAYRNKWIINKANSIVSTMVPLVPRTVEIDGDAVPKLKRFALLMEKIIPFSCWFIGKKFTAMPKMDINTRIVVIGASRTALGFLNALLFSQTSTYLTFNNVTLISPNGLPYTRHCGPGTESMFLKYYNASDKYLKCVPYTYYVNVVRGSMMEINLQEKFITLTNGNRKHYDLLFLFFGKQYQHPEHMVQLIQRDNDIRSNTSAPQYTRLDQPRFSDTEIQIANDDTPENVFIINTLADASKALKYVKKFIYDEHYKIIVYGATLHAYLCINALLEIKVPPEHIIFIEPFPFEDTSKTRIPVFDNVNVDQTVINILDTLKIKVYRSFYFKSWSVSVDNIITHADFLSYADYLNLECNALFYYGRTGVNMRAFIAIHKSGLAYDGGVIIDHDCRTLDPSVYAAGPCTRYHKRYYGDAQSHKYYDRYELGQKLGARIRNQLDPLFVEVKPAFTYEWAHDCVRVDRNPIKSTISVNRADTLHYSDFARPEMALIELSKPRVMYCVLPGGLKYLEVRSPGLKTPHNYVQSLGYNGFVFETFKAGYFKIHLNKEFMVDGMTCLSQGKFSLENFKHIYGRPATELNNMHLRYMANKLDDFFDFFRAPWAFFLYHDHTDELFAMIKQLFPKGQTKGLTLKEALSNVGMTLSPDRRSFTRDTKMTIQENFEKSPHIEAVTDFVIEWLSKSDILLPMYLQAGQTAPYEYDLDNNPLIIKRTKRNVVHMLV
ncbi:hypothetical protein PYW07_012195 [Mythimna separata]|uniref:Cilia- and flagella-associated protein 61 N-terminal domain-containing protein n=1 Tax=Mythimna separata TaxID=271217 RepID=A0AAD7YMX1_MYTSE|nr:hypothetical protein PYW07_012195 [Mythimna separata]